MKVIKYEELAKRIENSNSLDLPSREVEIALGLSNQPVLFSHSSPTELSLLKMDWTLKLIPKDGTAIVLCQQPGENIEWKAILQKQTFKGKSEIFIGLADTPSKAVVAAFIRMKGKENEN